MLILIMKIFFWVSAIALLHTYVFYPLIVVVLAKNKSENPIFFETNELPEIAIIMAAHNEEKIIAEKIESVLQSEYNQQRIKFYIGSDASTDKTDQIILEYARKNSNIEFENYIERVGKIHIVNDLVRKSIAPIIVLTDANAIFDENALYHLVKHFKNPEIRVVGGRLHNRRKNNQDVAFQEHTYMENEFKIKVAEGKIWGTMMGAYGAFFAIRRNAFNHVPGRFIADDFYISLKAIQNGGKAICEEKAVAYEDVSGDLYAEFKRKQRISAGNFQNLSALYSILFSGRFGLAFSFFSHKVLRWLGPIFIIMLIFSLSIIFRENYFYTILLILILLSLIVPIIDYFNRKSRIHIIILRFITHFYYMNAALLIGLFNFMKGVKSNVWEPTKRQ